MPKINQQNKPEPEQPKKPQKTTIWSPNLDEADEARAWELAERYAPSDSIEIVYTRAAAMQEFSGDGSLWSHLHGRNVEIWVASNDPLDPEIWDEGWVVRANDTGLLWASTGRIWFRPWSAIVQLTFNPEQDLTDQMYDAVTAEMQAQATRKRNGGDSGE